MSDFKKVFTPGSPTTGKKKRKRKKKKKSSSDANTSSTNDSQRVQNFIKMGFTRDQVHKTFDLMFAAGEDMNNDKKVKEFLNRNTTTAAATTTASTTTTTNNKKPGKPQKSTAPNPTTPTPSIAATAQTTSTTMEETKKAEQPLEERLEAATIMPAKIVMPVLIKWCRNYPDKRPILFESKALQQLFCNYTNDLLNSEDALNPSERSLYEAPMNELLRLAINRNDLADLICTQLSHFISSASTMAMQSTELNNVCGSLATSLVTKIRTFHRSTTYDEHLPQQIAQISRKISDTETLCTSVATQLKSDANNLAMMFDLRDLRSEMSELLSKKAELLSSLGSEHDASGPGYTKHNKKNNRKNKNKTSSSSSSSSSSDLAMLTSVGFSLKEIEKTNSSQTSAQELKAKIHSMTTKQEKRLSPLLANVSKVQTEKLNLSERYEALTKELVTIQNAMEVAQQQEEDYLTEQTRLEHVFDQEMSKLNEQNDGLVSQLRRGESQSEILKILKTLDDSIAQISKTMNDGDSNTQKKRKAQEAKLLQMLEGSGGVYGTRKSAIYSILEYVDSEKQCMSIINKRVSDTKLKIQKSTKELEQISKLGLGKVEAHMRATLEEEGSNLQEDSGLLTHLESQARQMLESVQTIVSKITEEPGTVVENDLAIHINEIKESFVALGCCGDQATAWVVPEIQPSRSSTSSGGFDTNKAASLGLSALIPKNYNESTSSSTAALDTKESKQQQQQQQQRQPRKQQQQRKKKISPAAAAAPVFKGWGAPKAMKGKSLATIQAEESLASRK
tara:strand:+ start:34 stop:2403 length:2370 start_codon:yes stop_codon:yes gene_type:complete